jgi:hypothetical protein
VKRLRSNANLGRKKYCASQHIEHSGIGSRMLLASEVEELQNHVERVRSGEYQQRPIRLKVPA